MKHLRTSIKSLARKHDSTITDLRELGTMQTAFSNCIEVNLNANNMIDEIHKISFEK